MGSSDPRQCLLKQTQPPSQNLWGTGVTPDSERALSLGQNFLVCPLDTYSIIEILAIQLHQQICVEVGNDGRWGTKCDFVQEKPHLGGVIPEPIQGRGKETQKPARCLSLWWSEACWLRTLVLPLTALGGATHYFLFTVQMLTLSQLGGAFLC